MAHLKLVTLPWARLCLCFPIPCLSCFFVDVSVTVVKVNKNAFKRFHGKQVLKTKQNKTSKTK
jgi:hypothetical protein